MTSSRSTSETLGTALWLGSRTRAVCVSAWTCHGCQRRSAHGTRHAQQQAASPTPARVRHDTGAPSALRSARGWEPWPAEQPRWHELLRHTHRKAEGCTPQSPSLTDPPASGDHLPRPPGKTPGSHVEDAAPCTKQLQGPPALTDALTGLGEVSSSPGQPVRDGPPQGGWRHYSLLLWDKEERRPTGRRVSDCRLQKSRPGHLGDSQARCCPKHPLRRGPHGVVRPSSGWGQDRAFGQFQCPSGVSGLQGSPWDPPPGFWGVWG